MNVEYRSQNILGKFWILTLQFSTTQIGKHEAR